MATVTPPQGASTPPSVSATGTVTPVEASVSNAPDKIQQLVQQIQVSGLITQPPDAGEVTLNTVIGNLTIVLPQLAQAQQDKLMQQLTALFQNQKPLTVVVQPGNPPTQAFLLLPPAPATSATQAGAAENNALQQVLNTAKPPPLTPGTNLPAVVLPPNTGALAAPASSATLALSSLAAAFPEGDISMSSELALLEQLAAKAQSLADTVIPQIQEKIFGNAPISLDEPLASEVFSQASAAAAPFSPAAVPPSANIPPALLALLQPGTELNLQVDGVALPSSANIPPALLALLQPGTELNLQVDGVALPSALPLVPALPGQIAATVIGTGTNGQLLVQAGDATLYVSQNVNAPVGSTLLITVQPSRAVPTPLPLPDDGTTPLQQALAALAQIDPQLARQVLDSSVPQPNAALTGTLLFLLSVFQQGSAREWLGSGAVDALTKAGRIELIAKLTQQLAEAGQTVQDPVVGAWRSFPVPVYNNGQFQVMNFYVHGDARGKGGKGEASGKSGVNAVRFLIDMRFSKLGAMQLDGFVKSKQLDMIVRSERNLPEGLHRDLRLTWADTLSAIGYAGSLNFQTGRQNWLNLRKAAGAGSVVT